MTQDEIIEMANEAGIIHPQMAIKTLEAFAKLVAIHVSLELAKECAGMGEWNAVHIIEGVRW